MEAPSKHLLSELSQRLEADEVAMHTLAPKASAWKVCVISTPI